MGASSTDKVLERNGVNAAAALAIGFGAGLAVYGILEFWLDEVRDTRAPLTALAFVVTFALSLLLLDEDGAPLRSAPYAAAIAAFSSAPAYFMLWVLDYGEDIHLFPALFWVIAGAPLSIYVLTALAKAVFDERAPRYSAVFFNGLTLPLVFLIAAALWLLGAIILFAGALLLRSNGVDGMHQLLQEPWFLPPLLGVIGAGSLALSRSQPKFLGAIRFIILLASRALTPLFATLSVMLLVMLAARGFDAAFVNAAPAATLLSVAFAGALAVNGVYQNGEATPPPVWLRVSAILVLATAPIFAAAAVYAMHLRIEQYGLTPPRVIALAIGGVALLYGAIGVAALTSEAKWRNKRWLPPLARLNMAAAGVWVFVLFALATPIADPWRISARDQVARVLNGKADLSTFDFGYLKFQLGAAGERALARLDRASGHPDYRIIQYGVARSRDATSYWDYQNAPITLDDPTPLPDGPSRLELNPADNPAREDRTP
ncbi:MAG: DUF4153 domain-containing protein [Pseudomonadota bacterium]